jgi:DNA-binding CsgD family transcriptional regulator
MMVPMFTDQISNPKQNNDDIPNLIRLAGNGDIEALRIVFDRANKIILNNVRIISFEEIDPQDVHQLTMIIIAKKGKTFNGEYPGQAINWILRIAVNEARRLHKKHSPPKGHRIVPIPEEEYKIVPDCLKVSDNYDDDDNHQRNYLLSIRGSILTSREREYWVRLYESDGNKTDREIARDMDIAPARVAQLKKSIQKKLKKFRDLDI